MSLINTPDIKVNGTSIPACEIDAELQYHPADSRRQAMIKAAESLILSEVLKQRAKQLGIAIEGSNKDSALSDAQLDELLAKDASIPQASSQECKRYFDANPDKFKTAPLIEARHILLAADPSDINGRSEMKTLAAELIKQLLISPTLFDEFAKRYSACPSKEHGGNLGQVSHGQTVPEFQRQLFAAGTGLMQQPIETRYGYHLVVVERKIEGHRLRYDAVKDRIETFLNEKVRRKALSQYLHRLVADADIEGFSFDLDTSPLMQ